MQWKTNKLIDLKKQYLDELLSFYEKQEALSLINILIDYFFGLSATALLINTGYRISESEMLRLHFAVKELKKYRPVQYIVGETEFLGLKIKVTDAVLIPRPETEELVQLIVENEKKKELSILDIGTGSGCIAIALEKNIVGAAIGAVDISTEALKIAHENNNLNDAKVDFQELNILDKNEWKRMGQYEVVVSNPPYVTQAEKNQMNKNVLEYEPHEALFVSDENALVFYECILGFAVNHLRKNGRIYFEINEAKGNEIVSLLKNNGFKNVMLHQDIHAKSRFISGIKLG